MMTVVVTISSSSVASITPRSTLLDTIILRTELMVKTELASTAPPDITEFTWTSCRWLVREGERGEDEERRVAVGFKFEQKIKHRQD